MSLSPDSTAMLVACNDTDDPNVYVVQPKLYRVCPKYYIAQCAIAELGPGLLLLAPMAVY